MIPFLLIPGINADLRVFSGISQVLWPFGPVTVANHRQGDRIEAIAQAILADAPPKFGLVGFSMGGYVSLEIMRQAPERVLKLALIDTSARPDTEEATANRRRMIALGRGGKFLEAVEQTFPRSVHAENVGNSDLYAVHRGMAEGTGAKVYEQQQEAAIHRIDSRPSLGKIRVPTLIVVGEDDQITVPEASREMHAAIAGSILVVVPRAGHFAPLETPEPVHAALREWAAA